MSAEVKGKGQFARQSMGGDLDMLEVQNVNGEVDYGTDGNEWEPS